MKTTTSPLSATDLAALERESWIDPATAPRRAGQAQHLPSGARRPHSELRGGAALKVLAQKAVKP